MEDFDVEKDVSVVAAAADTVAAASAGVCPSADCVNRSSVLYC